MATSTLPPDQQALVDAFRQKYPHIPPGGRLYEMWWDSHPQAGAEWTQIVRQVAPSLPAKHHINPATGSVERDISTTETLLTTAAILGGALVGGAALTGAFAGAGAGVGTGATSGAFVPAGTAVAPSVDIGADALAGGLTSGIGSTGTLASLGTGAGQGVSDVGAGAAVPAADASAGAVPSSVGPYASGYQLPAAAATPPTSLAANGGATAGSSFGKFVSALSTPTVIGAGLGLAGAGLQAYEAGKASDAQAQATRDALALQAQQYNTNTGLNVAQANQNTQAYNQTVSNLAPYRGIGASALSSLGYHLGLPGYEGGNTSVVNAPAPIVPVQPLKVPPPISAGGVPGQAIPNVAFIPTNQQTGGLPQVSSGNTWASNVGPQGQHTPMQAAQVGEKRLINGQPATYDGKGWVAA